MGSPFLAQNEVRADIFLGSLAVFQSKRVASAGGRKEGLGGECRPPYKFWAKSVRIFSNAHRQLGNVFVGSPSARARQPILSANWNFLSLSRYCGAGQKRAFLFGIERNHYF
ncbi:MAG: hypothetical protein A3H70_01625 [Candidatus Komeilibacteria bacterium RIFCSPLOWO2_02_FULL_48_11]|uniref:Uncharacterized protein n=1 Tax=Candidatus Komeilibacteria bacterium RIFCSPLOWO2_02_FULL_48_11 TaxID=1798553 RepID=A0A1G2BP44_9BACT|nr:MAG: hypothetical protein A3H70_01625 [Candidatus Komeilibacteria bacterium RIFCSPLOWO2_02_FULL_48_11]